VRLGEVCEIWDHLRKPVKKKDRIPGEVPYCGANGVIDYVSGFTHEGEFVLLAEDGGFYGPGEPSAYMMYGRFWANNHIHILLAKSDYLINAFLQTYLVAADLRPFLTGATRPKLTQRAMRSIPIPLPPLAEQRRIVARIEQLMARVREARRLRQAAREEAERLWQSVLADTFPRPGSALPSDWRWVQLGEVADVFSGTWGVDPHEPIPKGMKQVRVIRVSDIKENLEIDYENVPTRMVSEKEAERYTLKTGDIVVVKSSGSQAKVISGRAAVFKVGSETFIPSNFTFAVRCDSEKTDYTFLWYWLNSNYVKAVIQSLVSTFTYPNLKKKDYLNLPVLLPPLAEQRRIVAHLEGVQEKIRALRAAQAETEEELKRLEQAILDRAFKGEL
jgi:type I restriction enzyme S subunit